MDYFFYDFYGPDSIEMDYTNSSFECIQREKRGMQKVRRECDAIDDDGHQFVDEARLMGAMRKRISMAFF